jgi:hypothetical protein
VKYLENERVGIDQIQTLVFQLGHGTNAVEKPGSTGNGWGYGPDHTWARPVNAVITLTQSKSVRSGTMGTGGDRRAYFSATVLKSWQPSRVQRYSLQF